MSQFLAELKRRHIYKVGAMYCVAGWLIVQIATQVLPIFNVSALTLRIVVLVIVAGFPLALVLSWVFDITPLGIVRTRDTPSSEATPSIAHPGLQRRLNYVLAMLLFAALSLFALDHFVLSAPSDRANAGVESIAVLPLINESNDPDNEYFSDGLSEELINALAQIGPLRVISRASAFQFKNKNEDPVTIGHKLNVANLLEGSVRRSGTHLRIVAELINARDGSQRWSQTYDRELKDIFDVQSEIATSVATALKLTLLGKGATGPDIPSNRNLDAYNDFLQGNYFSQRGNAEDLRKGVSEYDQALLLDPNYALAYARLSDALSSLADQTLSGTEIADAHTKARAAAERALAIDPGLSDAHSALGWLYLLVDWNLPAAEAEFRRAVALAPNSANSKSRLAVALIAMGHSEEAVSETRAALALNPLHTSSYSNLATYLTTLGRYDDATQAVNRAIELQPAAAIVHSTKAIIDLKRADNVGALTEAQNETDEFWRTYTLALVQFSRGDHRAADAALQTLIDQDSEDGAYQIAQVYAWRGDPDEAFKWLNRAYATRDTGVITLFNSPFFLSFTGDPRFIDFCKTVGLPFQNLKIAAPSAKR